MKQTTHMHQSFDEI